MSPQLLQLIMSLDKCSKSLTIESAKSKPKVSFQPDGTNHEAFPTKHQPVVIKIDHQPARKRRRLIDPEMESFPMNQAQSINYRENIHRPALTKTVESLNGQKGTICVEERDVEKQLQSERQRRQEAQRMVETLKADLKSKQSEIEKQRGQNKVIQKRMDQWKRDYQKMADILLSATAYSKSVEM